MPKIGLKLTFYLSILLFFGFSEAKAFRLIVIEKYSRTLYVYENDHIIKAYPISLGWNPEAPKTRQGDGATPEGLYFITEKRPSRKYGLFLAISYPNLKDINLAYWEHRLDDEAYKRCLKAYFKKTPDPKCPLGFGLGIHGGGIWRLKKGKLVRDWTFGCVAMEDKDVADLYKLVKKGTPVLIFDAQKPLFEIMKNLVSINQPNLLFPWWGEWSFRLSGILVRVSLWEDLSGYKRLTIWGEEPTSQKLYFLYEDDNGDGRLSWWEKARSFENKKWKFEELQNIIIDLLPVWIEEKTLVDQGG
ncbi:L,D-transpeptidase family protein [Thermodesulfatator indicus]